MRKISIFIASLFIAGMSVTSCSSDDNGNNTSGSLVGKWNFISEKQMEDGDVIYDGPYTEHESGCSLDYLEFFENGSAIEGSYDRIDLECELSTQFTTYVREGNTLTVNDGGDIVAIQILEATSTKLVLKTSDTYAGVLEEIEFTFAKAD